MITRLCHLAFKELPVTPSTLVARPLRVHHSTIKQPESSEGPSFLKPSAVKPLLIPQMPMHKEGQSITTSMLRESVREVELDGLQKIWKNHEATQHPFRYYGQHQDGYG